MEILVADENRDLEVSGEVWLEMLTQTVTSGVRTGGMKSRLQNTNEDWAKHMDL